MQEAGSADAEERIRTRKRRSSADEQTERPQKILRGEAAQSIASEEVSRPQREAKARQLPSPPSIGPQAVAVFDRQLPEEHQPTDQNRPHTSSARELRKWKRERSCPNDNSGVSPLIGEWLSSLPATLDFDNMSAPPSKRSRSTDSLIRRPSLSSETPDTTISRDAKYSAYKDVNYTIVLETKNSFMRPSKAGLIKEDQELCHRFLSNDRALPVDSLFDEERFESFCSLLQGRSEAQVYLELHSLLVPSAENLYIRGWNKLENLIQGYNDLWVKAIPFYGPRPQPDHTVGFKWSTFNEEQRRKLRINPKEKSLYTAREDIYFPFLTSEVKCGKQALDLADRPNAHSMTVAIRGVVDLYRKVGRAMDVHRRVLGFSISHDETVVRIYAHYPEIQGDKTTYYRHTVKQCSFADEKGRQRWTPYRFTMNIYHTFAATHLTRLKSAIDQLPDPALEPVEPLVGLGDESTLSSQEAGLSGSESQDGDLKRPQKGGGLQAELRAMIQNLQRQLEGQRKDANQREANLAEQLRKQQELAQLQQEQQRKESEQQRKESEQQRKESEQQRKESEQQRKELMQMLSQQGEQLNRLLKL